MWTEARRKGQRRGHTQWWHINSPSGEQIQGGRLFDKFTMSYHVLLFPCRFFYAEHFVILFHEVKLVYFFLKENTNNDIKILQNIRLCMWFSQHVFREPLSDKSVHGACGATLRFILVHGLRVYSDRCRFFLPYLKMKILKLTFRN